MVRINSENRTLSFLMLDKVWKVGKSHFLGQKKTFFCGKIDLVIS